MRLGINLLNRISFILLRLMELIVNVFALIGGGIKASLQQNIPQYFTIPRTQRRIFSILRTVWPNLTLKRVFVKSYENNGTVIATRHQDVLDILNRNEDFEVVYESRMRKLTEGDNFFLGMQPGWDYTRDTSAMRLAVRVTDVNEIIVPRARELAEKIIKKNAGELSIVPSMTLHIPWDMTAHYFGVGAKEREMQHWASVLFAYLFQDFTADPKMEIEAMDCASKLRDYLDIAIQERKKNPTTSADILNRCLDLQKSNTPGMSDLGIRNNLLGLLIGAIPTISKACCLALDELLSRPNTLHEAQQAARNGEDEKFANYLWEALRFNPFNPVIYRRATRDSILSPNTLRALKVKKGQMVFSANFSACFDPKAIEKPNEFKVDRPWEDYIIWGYGMHRCFGDAINKAIIPAILKPLFLQNNLRRKPGQDGHIAKDDFGFPKSFVVQFDQKVHHK